MSALTCARPVRLPITCGCAQDANEFHFYAACDSKVHSAFIAVELIYKTIMVLWGTFLALEIREIDKYGSLGLVPCRRVPCLNLIDNRNFNESRSLGLAIYNLGFCSLVSN